MVETKQVRVGVHGVGLAAQLAAAADGGWDLAGDPVLEGEGDAMELVYTLTRGTPETPR